MAGGALKRGLFITLEGGEGSGKTTQIAKLAEALDARDLPVVLTREPGGVEGAEAIRTLLVEGTTDKWGVMAETLLFMAARAEHLERFILPKLEEGAIILCDRFLDSTLVYQGIAKKLGVSYLQRLHAMCFGNFAPDLTLLFDIDPEVGLARAGARKGDETRFEGMALEFHQQVRRGFLDLAAADPGRCAVIDASQSPGEVHKAVITVVEARLPGEVTA